METGRAASLKSMELLDSEKVHEGHDGLLEIPAGTLDEPGESDATTVIALLMLEY